MSRPTVHGGLAFDEWQRWKLGPSPQREMKWLTVDCRGVQVAIGRALVPALSRLTKAFADLAKGGRLT